MQKWYLKSETGPLKDVLLGPAESFRWLGLENAAYSSLVRDTMRKGYRFDKQLAMRQHREMVDAYEEAGVTCHFLPVEERVPYQVYARDSSFISPYGAVICQLANPRRRGEYAPVLRFYLDHEIPIYDMVSAGNFEGGDFNIIRPGVALVGYTDHRTEEVAARQVADWPRWDGASIPISGAGAWAANWAAPSSPRPSSGSNAKGFGARSWAATPLLAAWPRASASNPSSPTLIFPWAAAG